jgi:hypothetical protein
MVEIPKPSQPQTLTADQAGQLLGRSRQWVFNLVKDGHIEKQAKGKYTLVAVIRGAMAYYEDQLKKTSKTAISSRATDARAREIELRIEEKTRGLVPRDDANLALDLVVGEVNKQLSGLSARITRDVSLRRKIEAEVYETKRKIAEALASGKEFNRTGRDPTDTDAAEPS